MNLLNLLFGKRPLTKVARKAARRSALAKMKMGPRPKHSPPPKANGFKSGDKRKGPTS